MVWWDPPGTRLAIYVVWWDPLGTRLAIYVAKGSRKSYSKRLKDVCRQINLSYDVDGLCKEFPSRLEELVRLKGDKLLK